MTRTALRAGRWDDLDRDFSHAIELEKIEPDFERSLSKYEVYADGKLLGTVTSQREESSVQTGRGNRLRRVTGHPVRWRYTLDTSLFYLTKTHSRSFAYEGRYAAVRGLYEEAIGIMNIASAEDYERQERAAQNIREAAEVKSIKQVITEDLLPGADKNGKLIVELGGYRFEVTLAIKSIKEES